MGVLTYGDVVLVNVKCNYEDGEELVEGKDIILSADYGYMFEEGFEGEDGFEYYHHILKNRYPISMKYNPKYLTTTVNNWVIEDDDSFELTGKYEVVLNPDEPLDSPKHYLYYGDSELLNCTCNYEDGEELVEGKDIIILADDGYEFEEGFEGEDGFEYYNKVLDGTSIQPMNYTPNKLTYPINTFNINRDKTLLVKNPVPSGEEIEQIGTFVNLYNTTNEELTELSKKRFVTGVDDVIDYGQFITSLYVLPLKLDNKLLGKVKKDIILGSLNSGVKSTIINNYLFELNGGTIEVPLKYNNIYDFINTECILHVPFLDKIYLNSEYVIGQTLYIEMYIDLYSSNLTVNITSTFNNKIIASAKGVIGMNIPFMQKSNNSISNSLSNIYKNNIDRCFVEVNRNIPYTKNNNVFGGSVVEYGKIGDYTGYLECDKIVLETNATNQEQEEIKNLLRNGVFI